MTTINLKVEGTRKLDVRDGVDNHPKFNSSFVQGTIYIEIIRACAT
jgi:hypothetical protein